MPNDKKLSLREAAEFLDVSYAQAREDWPKWRDYGVVPIRYMGNPRGNLKFKKWQLERMEEKWAALVA